MNQNKYLILPEPNEVVYSEGEFDLIGCAVSVEDNLDPRVVAKAVELKTEISNKTGTAHSFYRSFREDGREINISKDDSIQKQGYTITVNPDEIKIVGGDDAGCFYGMVTLLQMLEIEGNNLPCVTVNDAPDMEFRGHYFDVSRGRILSVDGAKKFVDRLVYYKMNVFQIYIEHTFDFIEFRNMDRTEDNYITPKDIIEIDRYCYENFVDFQPSLSTFGHLYELLNKEEYKQFCELEDYQPSSNIWAERIVHHTIDPTNEGSIKLICSLIDQYAPLFRSKYFNICCDETFDLGKGRNKDKDHVELYITFVTKIINHIKSLGKTPMMWGDIILHHSELLERVPKGTIALNWDYRVEPEEWRAQKIAAVGLGQILCPSILCADAIIERISESEQNIQKYLPFAPRNGCLGMLNTTWGDYGHACHPECTLFGTILGACMSWNVKATVNEQFEKNISKSVYKSDVNIVPFIREMEVIQRTVNFPQCRAWMESKNPGCFGAPVEQAQQSVADAQRISKALAEIKGDEEILFCLKSAADTMAIMSSEVVEIRNNGAVSDEWREKVEKWFVDYKKAWLLSAKPSEIMELYNALSQA